MSGDPNWQLPGEPVTRRVANSSTGSMLCVGYRVEDVSGGEHTGVIIAIPEPPAEYLTVEWPDGSQSMHLPSRLLRVGTTRDNEQHAEAWLLDRGLPVPRPTTRAQVPPPPAVERDRHYVQVAFDEPTCQLLSSVLSVHIGQMAQLDEKAVLTPEGQLDLQLSRRARAQLLYGYAQWLEGS